ncbi:Fic family protein [Clostridium chauvoei]|uniref:Fic family protein n=3 Tax=Clostridium chauvoei TaxID=46867 RepID=A0ABD4RGF5_9CLOT
MFGDPVSNPKGWKKVICKDITSKIGSGATPSGGNSSYKEEGISLIRSMNVHNNKFIYKDLAFIDDEQAKKLKNVIIEENDILLNITGASVARSCIVPSAIIPARVNQHVSIIRCKHEEILPVFLVYQFTNESYQRKLWDIATSGGATREAITKQQLENLELIVPPIEIQNKFIEFIKVNDKLKFEFWILKLKMEKWVYNILIYDIERSDLEMEKSIDYNSFLQVLNETKGIHNSLNELLKYDFIYHSNKIEGSTFTTEALQLLFEKNIVTGTHTLDDVQETVNSFYTFDLVIESIDKELTLDMIKEWHSSLMYRTRLYDLGLAGVFKKYQNKIYGADFDTANPWEVEDNLNALIEEYYSLEKATIEDIAKFHLEFERIHPFQDGNGRIGRFIYLKQLLENRLALKYMNGETSSDYKNALGLSSSNNIKPLVEYINKQKDFIIENKNMF